MIEKCTSANYRTNRTRLLRSRATTPSSIPDSPRSVDSRSNVKSRSSLSHSPLRLTRTPLTSHVGYESDDSVRLDRASHNAVVQEVMSMKAMLLKLKRVLHESFLFACVAFTLKQVNEDILMTSETHNPFDTQRNGLFNCLSSETDESSNSRGSEEAGSVLARTSGGQGEDRTSTTIGNDQAYKLHFEFRTGIDDSLRDLRKQIE